MNTTALTNYAPSAPDEYDQIRQKIQSKGADEFAKMLESVFLQKMLEQMNKSMLSGGLFGKSHQGKIFQGLFMQALSEKISESGGLGLADIIAKNMESAGTVPDDHEIHTDIHESRNEMMHSLTRHFLEMKNLQSPQNNKE